MKGSTVRKGDSNKMKKIYECPQVSVVKFESDAVMLVSGVDDGYGTLGTGQLKSGKGYKLKS